MLYSSVPRRKPLVLFVTLALSGALSSLAQCNSDPIAAVDEVLHTGDPLVVDVLANDREPDGELLQVISIEQETCDEADVTAVFDTVRFIPTGKSSETCTITYRIQDESDRTADGTVNVISTGLLFKDGFETGDSSRWDDVESER
ncbi:MAG: Ig-like domain-containing protein [Acidobacteriota bacterium]